MPVTEEFLAGFYEALGMINNIRKSGASQNEDIINREYDWLYNHMEQRYSQLFDDMPEEKS